MNKRNLSIVLALILNFILVNVLEIVLTCVQFNQVIGFTLATLLYGGLLQLNIILFKKCLNIKLIEKNLITQHSLTYLLYF